MSLSKFDTQSYGHFVTTKTFRNKLIFRDAKCCEIVLGDIGFYRKKLGFKLLGYCVMPDYLHMIVWWDVDEKPELTISKVVQLIKSHSAKEIASYLKTGRRKPSLSPYSRAQSEGSGLPMGYVWKNKGSVHTPSEYQIWQSSFYDFNIYSEEKLLQKLNYLHWNPVRAGLCEKPEDWPWSSYRFYEFRKQGTLSVDTL
ncbi:MAG: transposase [Parcubacteria group bacterium]